MLCSTALGDSRGEAEQRVQRKAHTAESSFSSGQWEECTGGLAEEKTGDRVSPRPSGTGWKASRVAVRGADLEEEGQQSWAGEFLLLDCRLTDKSLLRWVPVPEEEAYLGQNG